MATPTLKELIEGSDPDHSPQPWNARKGLVVAPDGLPARVVKAHNQHKAHYLTGYSEIFSVAMKKKWQYRGYLDLYCGPGVCWVKDTGRFVLGSPLIALNVAAPFTHVVFNDLDEECTQALEQRMADTDAQCLILSEDANKLATLNRIRQFIPARHSLSLALLDPQGLDLDLETIHQLTIDRRMDLLINFPVHSLWRCLCKDELPILDRCLGKGWPSRTTTQPWRAEARAHFHGQLATMGYEHHEEKQVWSESKKSPLYDFILYSRSPLAKKFYKSVTRTDASRQEPLFAL